MGLDMYLETEELLWRSHGDEADTDERKAIHAAIPWMEKANPEGYLKVVKEVGYWRKANHVHKWFVNNVQDGKDECQRSYVERKQLKELLELCKQVKDEPSKAHELLPTASGFFFGGTEYDEYYYESIDQTIETLELVLANVPDSCELYYHASW